MHQVNPLAVTHWWSNFDFAWSFRGFFFLRTVHQGTFFYLLCSSSHKHVHTHKTYLFVVAFSLLLFQKSPRPNTWASWQPAQPVPTSAVRPLYQELLQAQHRRVPIWNASLWLPEINKDCLQNSNSFRWSIPFYSLEIAVGNLRYELPIFENIHVDMEINFPPPHLRLFSAGACLAAPSPPWHWVSQLWQPRPGCDLRCGPVPGSGRRSSPKPKDNGDLGTQTTGGRPPRETAFLFFGGEVFFFFWKGGEETKLDSCRGEWDNHETWHCIIRGMQVLWERARRHFALEVLRPSWPFQGRKQGGWFCSRKYPEQIGLENYIGCRPQFWANLPTWRRLS